MKVPEAHPNCEGYQKIDKDLVEALKKLEWFNEAMIAQFFELNSEEKPSDS